MTTEGANQSVTGTATDNADNTGEVKVDGINIDKTAPTLRRGRDGSPNAAGWYNGQVTVEWTAGDALSGLAAPPRRTRVAHRRGRRPERPRQTVADKAGNTKSADVAGDQASTAPRRTPAPSRRAAGRRPTRPSRSSPHDGLSGVKETYYKLDGGAAKSGTDVAIAGNGTHTLEYWSVDNAGNEETHKTVDVKIDGTLADDLAHAVAGRERRGLEQHQRHRDVQVRGRRVRHRRCTPDKVDRRGGRGQIVTGTATDNAGNTATDPAVVNIDKTAPTITRLARPRRQRARLVQRPTSRCRFLRRRRALGRRHLPDPTTLGEGENQSVTGTATDAAGNTGSDTVAGINIDKTAPIAERRRRPPTRTRPAGTTATSRCTGPASDALSGLDGGCAGRRDDHGRGRRPLRVRHGHRQGRQREHHDGRRHQDRPHRPDHDGRHDRAAGERLVHQRRRTSRCTSTDNLSGVATTYYTVDGGDGAGVHRTRSATA